MKNIFILIKASIVRFNDDHGFSRAAGLAYTTLLALLPIAALSLSFFNVFGLDREQTLKTFLDQLLPRHSNEQLSALQNELFVYIDTFVTKFSDQQATLNILSIVILVLTGVGLLSTIESAVNNIWKTRSRFKLFSRLASFWAVITLGPLFISLSIYFFAKFSSITTSFGFLSDQDFVYTFLVSVFSYIVPISFSALGLSLLYFVLPSAKVSFRSAVCGGLTAGILFEIIKIGFGYYVARSASYNAIYGVLATIPLFLFWLYLTWVVILYGAEISWIISNRKTVIKKKLPLKTLRRTGSFHENN